MKVAIIIVNYNDVDDTVKYVNTIRNYDILNRIMIVDNNSTNPDVEGKLEALVDDKVKFVKAEKNGGYNYGNNYGIKYLDSIGEKYDYIVISNPDIKVSEEAINHSIEVLKSDDKIAVIAPRMYNKDDLPIRRSSWRERTIKRDIVHSTRLLEALFFNVLFNGEYSDEEYEKNEILEVEAISGSFFIIKDEVLRKIGLFDENVFLFYEEDILSRKIKELGMKIVSLNSEKFIHYESQTIGKTFTYFKKMNQMFISKMYYHKTYNHINKAQIALFHFLNICRKIELLVEVPVRKLLKK